MYKNSQKRIHVEEGIYFVTTNTFNSFPYFENETFCKVLVEDIYFTQKLKSFILFGYKINPDHIHILLKPEGKENISEIMRSLKTNSSRNINRIIHSKTDFSGTPNKEAISKAESRDSAFNSHLEKYIKEFSALYVEDKYPKFQWQESFNDHVIRNDKDFRNHIDYINKQWIKHNLHENKFCFIDEELCGKYLMGF